MGKIKVEKRSRKNLADDILEKDVIRQSQRTEKQRNRKDEDEEYVDKRTSSKILEQARAQQEELDEEYGIRSAPKRKKEKKKQETVMLRGAAAHDSESDYDNDEDLGEYDDEFFDGGDGFDGDFTIEKEDEDALNAFMTEEPEKRRTLADIILEKMAEKKTEVDSQFSVGEVKPKLDEKVVKCYKTVGKILSKYRSGKIPKAFKIIPSVNNWEEILFLTNPDAWTAAATYQATRLFASNLSAKLAQRFYSLILYPRVRDDIAEYKRLNYHLYMALKKALFKPAAFFKGILLPLCQAGNCSLREAVIIGSVITKCSIPLLHSSAALLKIAEMDYNGANSIFLRLLIEKKYALPYRVVDAVVFHFIRFLSDDRDLPVLWHQSFLRFVQIYKEDISSEQKEALIELCQKHFHAKITPLIKREILNSKSRDIEDAVPANMEEDEDM